MPEVPNPYDPPRASSEVEVDPQLRDAVELRRHVFGHEVGIRSLAPVYLLLSILPFVYLWQKNEFSSQNAAIILALLLFSAAALMLAKAVFRLERWAYFPLLIVSAVELCTMSWLSAVGGAHLYLLLSQKGRMAFSKQYQEVIQQTKHVRFRVSWTSCWPLALVVLLIAYLVLQEFLGLPSLAPGTFSATQSVPVTASSHHSLP